MWTVSSVLYTQGMGSDKIIQWQMGKITESELQIQTEMIMTMQNSNDDVITRGSGAL